MPFHDYQGAAHLTVGAAEDLRSLQSFGVQAHAAGVRPAASVDSGTVYVLANKPNSGENVKAYGPGSTCEAKAGGAITLGAWVTIAASGYFVVGSYGNRVGNALEAVSSGSIFSLLLV